tara:strand:+ start:2443 stop:2679 length:237 start_codon:yes stop_codon:yes gene_type:complete
MQEKTRYIEQDNSVQERYESEVRNGGAISGSEGGLRLDIFDHDVNSEVDFTEDTCSLCELPEHAQNLIIEDIEYEQNA